MDPLPVASAIYRRVDAVLFDGNPAGDAVLLPNPSGLAFDDR
jgi:hypothetical protein